jgi:hypothetical protein
VTDDIVAMIDESSTHACLDDTNLSIIPFEGSNVNRHVPISIQCTQGIQCMVN